MIQIFISDIENGIQADGTVKELESTFPGVKFNFDLNDSSLNDSSSPFPCGHTILRAEGTAINAEAIISTLNKAGFRCAILEDKVCSKTADTMEEFWETSFIEKQEMWGFEPSRSAVLTNGFFVGKGVKNVLIPGIGYGRNARVFRDNGMAVTGIELSKTAIEMARKHYGTDMAIHHGSVVDMPFDNYRYDGIFCYALIHLLDAEERKKLIMACYYQLSDNGYMVFTALSKEAHTYGKGKHIGKDRYELFGGVKMFFYDRESVHAEFDGAGLVEITEIKENFPFFLVKCRKAMA